MEHKPLVGLGMKRPLGNKIIRKMSLDRSNFTGEDCLEYFNLRAKDLKEKMDQFFPGQYKFKNHGNEHIFENKIGNFVYDKYSVHYMCDEQSFNVTETVPKYGLFDKVKNDNW